MLESLFYSVYSVLAVKIRGPIRLHLDYRKSKIHLRVRRTGRSCEGQWQTTLEEYREPQDFETEERPSQNPRISNLLIRINKMKYTQEGQKRPIRRLRVIFLILTDTGEDSKLVHKRLSAESKKH